MRVKQMLVNLLCDFPNVSITRERQTFIDSVGLTNFADKIDFEGNTRTFFNNLIDLIARSGDRDGMFDFLDGLTSSNWVGIDRVREIENLKAEIQNLTPQQFRSEFIGGGEVKPADLQNLTPQQFRSEFIGGGEVEPREIAPSFSGKAKIQFCRRLGKDWLDLAVLLEIPEHNRSRFKQGYECQEILEWLRERDRLNDLKSALTDIDRQDLVDLLGS